MKKFLSILCISYKNYTAYLPVFLQTIAYLSPFAYFGYTTWLMFSNFELYTFLKYFSIQMIWFFINLSICILLYNHAKKKLTINWG